MHEYRLLNAQHLAEIAQQRLFDLEAEHARLALDLRLAHATGVENDQVAKGEERLALLVQQIATLTSWTIPAPEAPPTVSTNGQGH